MRLDFVDLRLFVTLTETGSLSRTAEAMSMALSAVSQRLRKMEVLYGTTLLRRHSRGITPTPAGDTLLFHARRLLAAQERLDGEMGEISHGIRREIRLCCNTVANTVFLPDVLGPFLAADPDIDIRLSERPSREIARAIEQDDADIGILDGSIVADHLTLLPFARDRLVVVTALGHPLATTSAIDFAHTLAHPFVGLSHSSAIQLFLEDMAHLQGRPLRLRVRSPNIQSQASLVGAGAGLAIMPARIARRYAPLHALHVIELRDSWASRELKLCVRDPAALPAHGRRLLDALLAAGHDKHAVSGSNKE